MGIRSKCRTHIIWELGQWGPARITSSFMMSLGWTLETVLKHMHCRVPSPSSGSAGGRGEGGHESQRGSGDS